MVFIAINNEWLTRDPFREYEIKKEETTRGFLTKEEIRMLMDGKLKTPNRSFTVTCICSVRSRGCHSPICAICERKISVHASTTMSG